MAKTDSSVIKTHINTIVLRSLEDGEKYGLDILKFIKEKSNGTIELKQPTLYSSLKRLESMGLISSFWKNSDIGGKRHYYELTEKGKTELHKSKQTWLKNKQIFNHFIDDSNAEANIISNATNAEANIISNATKSVNNANEEHQQINLFDEVYDLNKKTESFKQAMAELKTTKESSAEHDDGIIVNRQTDPPKNIHLGTLVEAAEEKQATHAADIEEKIKKEEKNDAVFLTNKIDWNSQADEQEIKKLEKQKTTEENTKNDAVFITERYTSAPPSSFLDQNLSELNKSYDESELDMTINYISSPLTLSEDEFNKVASLINSNSSTSKQNLPIATEYNYSISIFNGQKTSPVRTDFIQAAKVRMLAATITLLIVLIQFAVLIQKNILTNLKNQFYTDSLICLLVFGIILFLFVFGKFLLNPNLKKKKKRFTFLISFAYAFLVFAIATSAVSVFRHQELFLNGFSFTTLVTIFASADIIIYFVIKKILSFFKIFAA